MWEGESGAFVLEIIQRVLRSSYALHGWGLELLNIRGMTVSQLYSFRRRESAQAKRNRIVIREIEVSMWQHVHMEWEGVYLRDWERHL